MKKLFISQPAIGKTENEITQIRKKAIESAKRNLGEEVEVIEINIPYIPEDATPLWFLGKSIEFLSQADIVYFAYGWEKSKRCRIENQCAIAYGINVIEVYKNESARTKAE